MIKWQDTYATGSEPIDKQHRLLFDIFNDFEDHINDGRGKEYMEKCFPLLDAYAKAHFKFEENCMHEHQCPVAMKNKVAHKTFLSTIEEFKKIFKSGQYQEDFFKQIHAFLKQWLIVHIIGIDVHLKECMNQ